MKLYRNLTDIGTDAHGGVVVIGNFDGIHRGHQALIRDAAALAETHQAPLVIMTFEPHPRQYFAPDSAPFRLATFRDKARLLQGLGVGHLLALRFDETLAQESAEDFINARLINGLRAKHVMVGQDFRFGHKRQGDETLMRQSLSAAGIGFTAMPVVGDADGVLSSSRVRQFLGAGAVDDAASILGRPVTFGGVVQMGAQRGRTIDFPTANIAIDPLLKRPAYGVYAVRAAVAEDKIEASEPTNWWSGIANIGRRPTVDGVSELLEVHLFDAQPDLYDQYLRVELVAFIRPEQKFDDFEQLKQQIVQDAAQARALLAEAYASNPP
ncbi:MAG: bifunctional riboflavin kinase/FAD synthetase [Pseudomonadota bacterium]